MPKLSEKIQGVSSSKLSKGLPREEAPLRLYHGGFEREIRPANVTRWIVSTIQLANLLTNTSPDLRCQVSVTTHEVRALSASWAAYKGVALGDVLEAATWNNHSRFSQFYLRDCSVLADGMR
jgi:hypothetical protein